MKFIKCQACCFPPFSFFGSPPHFSVFQLHLLLFIGGKYSSTSFKPKSFKVFALVLFHSRLLGNQHLLTTESSETSRSLEPLFLIKVVLWGVGNKLQLLSFLGLSPQNRVHSYLVTATCSLGTWGTGHGNAGCSLPTTFLLHWELDIGYAHLLWKIP